MEEGLLSEDHRGEHGTKGPHVQRVIILLKIDQQFRALEVSRCNTDVVFRAFVIKFGQAPVNESKLNKATLAG